PCCALREARCRRVRPTPARTPPGWGPRRTAGLPAGGRWLAAGRGGGPRHCGMDTPRSVPPRACGRTSLTNKPISPRVQLAVDELKHLGRLLTHEWLAAAGFHVEAHQRLGVGAAQGETPLCELHRQAVSEV